MKRLTGFVGAVLLAACGGEGQVPAQPVVEQEGQTFSSAEATLLELDFRGELVTTGTSWTGSLQTKIQDQLLYTIGHLNGQRSVGRLDRLVLSEIASTPNADGTLKVTYRAKLPVAWGSKTNLPTTYDFTLPRDATAGGFTAFTDKYKDSCVDWAAHDVDSGSMWYYYRPDAADCALAETDVVKLTATVTTSTENTTGKYPEYDKVWADNALHVVAVFGKEVDFATENTDAGIAAYNTFLRSVRAELKSFNLVTTPATVPDPAGIANADVTFTATLPDGKTVVINALLVDNVRTAGPAFDARYEALSTHADVIAYNGHAGLGSNVRALARKGRFVAGKYLVVFMNGCDTFAYVDGALAETRARVNPDDPTGTKYMDIITNAMPAYFTEIARDAMALIRALLKHQAPLTYQQIFASIDRSQVVVVTGEEDNVYKPGGNTSGADVVLEKAGVVARAQEQQFQTAALKAGKYKVQLSPDPVSAGGDADLYVKVGTAPTKTVFDCRPYVGGSNEECTVDVAEGQIIHVGVIGYATTSSFKLTVTRLGGGTGSGWAGLDVNATIARDQESRWETPQLAAGTYTFTLSGSGDADLYVKLGAAPTATSYDCRPYRAGSAESCTVTVTAPSVVHVMARGWAATSEVRLVGR